MRVSTLIVSPPMADPLLLPNLFVIGAAKCGTTSLHHYLDSHPDISMSSVKEPGLFSFTPWEERIAGYGPMFRPDARIRGESSTRYTYYPNVQGVPQRIASKVPDARFIYMVRDPIDRVVAHYTQQYASVMEQRTLDSAIRDLDQPGNFYVAPSRYATQLERWLDVVDRERILVIDHVDLLRQRADTVKAALRFLGVEDGVALNLDTEFNVGETKERMTPAGARVWFMLMPAIKRLPAPARARLSGSRVFPLERIGRPALSDRMRELLAAELKPEADRLRELTGMAFESWSV
jgi:hypothetical protein